MTEIENLADVVKDLGITVRVFEGCADEDQIREDRRAEANAHKDPQDRRSALQWADAFAWTARLEYQGRFMAVAYWTGIGNVVPNPRRKLNRDPATIRKVPTAADVLGCLVSDARSGGQTFAEWCSDLDYDPDSRKALATWEACNRTVPRLKRLLGEAFDRCVAAEW